jgi:uncharacterized membrane protein
MKQSKTLFKILLAAYAFFWVGGIGAYLIFGQPPEHVAWTAPVFLFFAGVLSLWMADRGNRLPLVGAGVLGFAFEVMGVYTGFPFGGYEYTDALAPRVLTVPLAMIPAWIVLIGYVRAMLAAHTINRWAIAAVGAAWMTAIDLVLDPVAAGPMGLWVWDNAGAYYGIPASNFAGWFITSLLILAILPLPKPNLALQNLGLSIVGFFVIMALLHGFVIAGGLGLGLVALHAAFARRIGPHTLKPLQGETK